MEKWVFAAYLLHGYAGTCRPEFGRTEEEAREKASRLPLAANCYGIAVDAVPDYRRGARVDYAAIIRHDRDCWVPGVYASRAAALQVAESLKHDGLADDVDVTPVAL